MGTTQPRNETHALAGTASLCNSSADLLWEKVIADDHGLRESDGHSTSEGAVIIKKDPFMNLI